jgi:hypothetical protein
VRLGFEVRVELVVGAHEAWVQVTRGLAERLELQPGRAVNVRPQPEARRLIVAAGR